MAAIRAPSKPSSLPSSRVMQASVQSSLALRRAFLLFIIVGHARIGNTSNENSCTTFLSIVRISCPSYLLQKNASHFSAYIQFFSVIVLSIPTLIYRQIATHNKKSQESCTLRAVRSKCLDKPFITYTHHKQIIHIFKHKVVNIFLYFRIVPLNLFHGILPSRTPIRAF